MNLTREVKLKTRPDILKGDWTTVWAIPAGQKPTTTREAIADNLAAIAMMLDVIARRLEKKSLFGKAKA